MIGRLRCSPGLGRLAVVLVGLAVLVGAGCAQSPEAKKQKALARGEQFLKDGKNNEAIIELRAALAIDKDLVPALHALGRAYAAKAWLADAGRELGRAHGLAPDSIPIAIDYGRTLLQAGGWKDAEGIADRVLSREPANTSALYIRAAALLGQGKIEDTQRALDAIPKESRTAEIESVRAETLLRTGKVDEAEQAFRAVLAGTPKNVKALTGLGRIEFQRQRYKEAVAQFEEAKRAGRGDLEPRLGLAESKSRLGQTKEAIAELEGIDLKARSLAVPLALARYYLADGRPTEVIALLAPVVERLPKLPASRALLGHAYLASRRPDQAAVQFDSLARLEPNEPMFQLWLATALLQQGKGREALAKLDAVAGPLDKIALYHGTRANALLLVGRLDDATKAAENALRLAPQNPQPYLVLGQIRAQKGQVKAASELFARAAELDASYVPARLALGYLHVAQKDMTAALKDFDAAVEANPKSLAAVQTKAAALVQDNRVKEAVQFLEGSVARDPQNGALRSLLAAVYYRDQQAEKAGIEYRKAVEIDPRAVAPRIGLARLAVERGADKEAVTQLQTAVKEQPDHLGAVLMLVSLYEKLAQYDLAVSTLEPAIKAHPAQPMPALALGEMYVKQGRYDDAIARMSETLSQAPDLVSARLIRGRAYLAKADPAAAIKDFSEAVRVSPKLAVAHYFLARALVASGRKPEAQAQYREALTLDPKLERARTELAAVSGQPQDEGTRAQRITDLQDAVKAAPNNLEAHEQLARAYLAQGKLAEAQGELKFVLDRAPGRTDANVMMAGILFRQERADDASAYVRAALKTNPSHVDANLMLARYLQQKGRKEEALTHMQAALRVNPNLANLYGRFGSLPDALSLARELERREPKAPGPPTLVAQVLLAQQSPEAAAEAFRRAIKLKPDLGEAHRGLGDALQRAGQAEPAMESYRQAVTLNGNDALSLNNLAWLLSEVRKRPDEALPLATRAADLAPKATDPASTGLAAAFLDTLGWIQFRRGAFGEAEKALSRAAGAKPGDASIQFHLGVTYKQLGKRAQAVTALKRAAELSPDLAKTEKIADLLRELGG